MHPKTWAVVTVASAPPERSAAAALIVRTSESSQCQAVKAHSASKGSFGSGQSSNAETTTSTEVWASFRYSTAASLGPSSTHTTWAPRAVSAAVACPVPGPTSASRVPGPISASSARSLISRYG